MSDHAARLYYSDSYLREFSAEVVEARRDGHEVVLSASAFYPTSGGQLHDLGTLNGVPVVDVRNEGQVVHVLAGPLGAARGATVTGLVDWARRYDHMQQHTGQHLLSAVCNDEHGWTTESVQFGDESCAVELASSSLDEALLARVEARCNAIVAEARPVSVSFEEAESAQGLRKPSGREGLLRIVTIQDLDRSACGGTHVRTTAECGPILLRGTEKIRGRLRLSFACGQRALRLRRREWAALSATAQALTCAAEAVPETVFGLQRKAKEAGKQAAALQDTIAQLRLEALLVATPSQRLWLEQGSGYTAEELRAMAKHASGKSKAVLVGLLTEPAGFVLGAGRESGADAGALVKELATLGVKGGGSPRLAQATLTDAAHLPALRTRLRGLV